MRKLVQYFLAVILVYTLMTTIAYAGNLWTEGSYLKDGDIYTPIEVPDSIGTTNVTGINISGQIVGVYMDLFGLYHGFLKDGDDYIPIDFPGASATAAMAISNNGQIVGNYFDSNGLHNFLLHRGISTSFIYPDTPSQNSYVHGINAAGQIAGSSGDVSWLKEGDTYTPITLPGASYTHAIGINDFGQIVGWYGGNNLGSHGFIKDESGFVSFDFPGTYTSVNPRGINNLGKVVGWYYSPEGQYAFVKDGDIYTSFSFPGSLSNEAYNINDAGQIVGMALGQPRVLIDIKPGDDSNTTNLNRKTVSVAILSNADFDAPSSVDQTSLTFGALGYEESLISCSQKAKDVNGDGLKDLVCTFSVKTAFRCYSTKGVLLGETKDTQILFEGGQRIAIAPSAIPPCNMQSSETTLPFLRMLMGH